MSKIVPAILEDSVDLFADKLAAILKIPEIEVIQVDFSDGKFTPRKTIAVSDIDVLNPVYSWEAHLMVNEPENYFLDAKIAGFNTIIICYESVSDKSRLKKMADDLHSYKINVGICINPETPVQAIFPYLKLFDQVTLLGVVPGYQGQVFQEKTLEKLAALKQEDKTVKVEIDGGLKLENSRRIAKAGADLLVAGSVLFEHSENGKDAMTPAQVFEHLETQTNIL